MSSVAPVSLLGGFSYHRLPHLFGVCITGRLHPYLMKQSGKEQSSAEQRRFRVGFSCCILAGVWKRVDAEYRSWIFLSDHVG